MARSDGRVTPGQGLGSAFSARAWNRAQDAADKILDKEPRLYSQYHGLPAPPYTTLPVRNMTQNDFDRFSVMAVDGIETSGGGSQFVTQPVLRGYRTDGVRQNWVVCLEPIPSGTIGRCAVDGVVQCKIDVRGLFDQYVRSDSASQRLVSSGFGSGLILWREGTIGTNKWALVRMGNSGGLVMIEFAGQWLKNQNKTVNVLNTNDQITVVNRFASITSDVCSSLNTGAAVQHLGTWYLIAAEFV